MYRRSQTQCEQNDNLLKLRQNNSQRIALVLFDQKTAFNLRSTEPNILIFWRNYHQFEHFEIRISTYRLQKFEL